ncbi:15077_t:CDS:1, partial [Dentiscutata heterogama]
LTTTWIDRECRNSYKFDNHADDQKCRNIYSRLVVAEITRHHVTEDPFRCNFRPEDLWI